MNNPISEENSVQEISVKRDSRNFGTNVFKSQATTGMSLKVIFSPSTFRP